MSVWPHSFEPFVLHVQAGHNIDNCNMHSAKCAGDLYKNMMEKLDTSAAWQ